MSIKLVPTVRRWIISGTIVLFILALIAVSLPLQSVSASGVAQTCSTFHTVSSGETLSSIALKYNTSVEEIASANSLKEPYTIVVGQRLCIPAGAVSATPTATKDETLSSNSPDFVVSTGPYSNWISVKTGRFDSKTPYYVRVFVTGDPGSSKKLGTMRTDKNGAATRNFKLPKQFRNVDSLTYCMKNAFSDEVMCKVY